MQAKFDENASKNRNNRRRPRRSRMVDRFRSRCQSAVPGSRGRTRSSPLDLASNGPIRSLAHVECRAGPGRNDP